MPSLYWFVAFINVAAAVLILCAMLSDEVRQFHWTRRIPLGIASASLSMTAAFQIGAWRPDEWTDLMTLLITFMAGVYVVTSLWRRAKHHWQQLPPH